MRIAAYSLPHNTPSANSAKGRKAIQQKQSTRLSTKRLQRCAVGNGHAKAKRERTLRAVVDTNVFVKCGEQKARADKLPAVSKACCPSSRRLNFVHLTHEEWGRT